MKRILSLLLSILLVFCAPVMAEDTAETLQPVPVGEDGIPFLGEWRLEAIEMDGTSVDPALLGMEMVITLTEDGLVSLYDGMETMQATWFVSYGVAVVDGALLKLREDGKLVLEEEDGVMIFTQGEVAETEELSEEELMLLLLEMMSSTDTDTDTAESALAEEHRSFVGDWHLCYCAADDLTGDLRRVGAGATLTLYEDYTGYLWCFPEAEGGSILRDAEGSWINEEGVLCLGEASIPLRLLGDEASGLFLQHGTEEGGYLIFSQNEQAVWTPAIIEAQPAAAMPDASAPAPAPSITNPMEIRFICKQFTTSGITGDAATLGTEYAVVFHDNGTADLTLSGITMPALPYAITEDGVYSIDYYGILFNCVPTETGFDLDYYGTMTLHLVPEG